MALLGAAAIGAAGGLLAGGLNYYGQKQANKQNVASARESMDFQERMSSTAYQRSMEDMRKAGLNPILAARQGGASTPGGAQALAQNEMSGAVSSALDAKRMIAEVANIKEQTILNRILQDKTRADIANNALSTASQVRLQNAQGDNYDSSSLLNLATAKNVNQNMTLKSPLAPIAALAHDVSQGTADAVRRFPNLWSNFTNYARDEYKRRHSVR